MAVNGDGTAESAECTDAGTEVRGGLEPRTSARLRRNAEGGRHRLPSTGRGPSAVTAPPAGARSAAVTDDIDEECAPALNEQPDDVDDARDVKAASVTAAPAGGRRARVIAFGVLPALTVILGGSAGYLTWKTISADFLRQARVESVRAAADGAAALLTYHTDTVDSDLRAARERLTGKFKTSYTAYTHQVVIPDSHRKHISAVATVPAAASVWATTDQAVVMVFVNQTFNSDFDPPTGTASSVRVTLAKVGGRWLISDFTPV